jgi:hypothetical protein
LRVKEDYDGAEPSGNSMAAINMIRLSSIFDAAKSEGYKRNVEHLLVCTYLVYNYMHYTTAIYLYTSTAATSAPKCSHFAGSCGAMHDGHPQQRMRPGPVEHHGRATTPRFHLAEAAERLRATWCAHDHEDQQDGNPDHI